MSQSNGSQPAAKATPAPEIPLLGRSGPGSHRPMGKGERAKNQRATIMRIWRYLRRQRISLIVTSAGCGGKLPELERASGAGDDPEPTPDREGNRRKRSPEDIDDD